MAGVHPHSANTSPATRAHRWRPSRERLGTTLPGARCEVPVPGARCQVHVPAGWPTVRRATRRCTSSRASLAHCGASPARMAGGARSTAGRASHPLDRRKLDASGRSTRHTTARHSVLVRCMLPTCAPGLAQTPISALGLPHAPDSRQQSSPSQPVRPNAQRLRRTTGRHDRPALCQPARGTGRWWRSDGSWRRRLRPKRHGFSGFLHAKATSWPCWPRARYPVTRNVE